MLSFPRRARRAAADTFRIIREIPPGAGYIPRAAMLDINESAALQERARADHQAVLKLVADEVHARGGTCSYNNNVDLYADFGAHHILVEAKSLGELRDAVDRMRYGLGQLADYTFRYKAELRGALPMLAFGRLPTANRLDRRRASRKRCGVRCTSRRVFAAAHEAARASAIGLMNAPPLPLPAPWRSKKSSAESNPVRAAAPKPAPVSQRNSRRVRPQNCLCCVLMMVAFLGFPLTPHPV